MPVFKFVCPVCRQPDRRLLPDESAAKNLRCRKKMDCRGVLQRAPEPAKAHMKEVIDTGLANMPKRIERFVDIEQMVSERSRADHRTEPWQKALNEKA